jgi:hypothetical protein
MAIEPPPKPPVPVPEPKPEPVTPDPEKEAKLKKRASRLIRAGEIAGMVQDEAVIETKFSEGVKANGGRSAGQVHFPSNSGATLGFGHDIGQASTQEIDDFYGPVGPNGPRLELLPKAQRETLKTFVGQPRVKGGQGSAAFIATDGIQLSYKDATEVFEKHLLPKYIDAARKAHPGFDDLPYQQQAAIATRVYMRGPAVNKDEGAKGAQAWVQLHEAIFQRNTLAVVAALKNYEAVHKNSPDPWSTQGRARANTALAYEGYMSTQETGEVPWAPIG